MAFFQPLFRGFCHFSGDFATFPGILWMISKPLNSKNTWRNSTDLKQNTKCKININNLSIQDAEAQFASFKMTHICIIHGKIAQILSIQVSTIYQNLINTGRESRIYTPYQCSINRDKMNNMNNFLRGHSLKRIFRLVRKTAQICDSF